MYVRTLAVSGFRSWRTAELDLDRGVTVLVGPNGEGKTNLLEALGYLATLGSHRVSTDGPLVRQGSDRAVLRATVVHAGRELTIELEISPGRANRARVNRSPVTRPREVLGILRTVLFSPEDLALIRGDPADRRRFLDDLLLTRTPRLAGVRADYDKVLRQRAALLKAAGPARRAQHRATELASLDAWDGHLARLGAELIAARLDLLTELSPPVIAGYGTVAGAAQGARPVSLRYRSSLGEFLCRSFPPESGTDRTDVASVEDAMMTELARVRDQEIERGVCLVGPHRDDLDILLDGTVAKSFASQGESWSLSLALRLGSYDLLRTDGAEPVLLLDDVFAELDRDRRARLVEVATAAEQVFVTAAVADDVPAGLDGAQLTVQGGGIHRVE